MIPDMMDPFPRERDANEKPACRRRCDYSSLPQSLSGAIELSLFAGEGCARQSAASPRSGSLADTPNRLYGLAAIGPLAMGVICRICFRPARDSRNFHLRAFRNRANIFPTRSHHDLEGI